MTAREPSDTPTAPTSGWSRRVRERRVEEHKALIRRARRFVEAIPQSMGLVAAVVFGSVARGDFNVWSDVDVLVVARDLPARLLDRLSALSAAGYGGVQPIVWTPEEFDREFSRGNPIAREAVEKGIELVGRLPG